MLTELTINDHMGPFSYASKIAFFKKRRRRVKFRPGLNVLVGPNGSGKSTIINMLARYLAAEQGGVSTVTEQWLSNNYDMFDHKSKLGYVVAHDGRPVLFGNPRNSVGLQGGAFDDDFFHQGLLNVTRRGSTGEVTMQRMDAVFLALAGQAPFPSEIERRINRNSVNSTWQKAFDAMTALLEPTIDTGLPTVLLDEPESGLSLPFQARLWSKLLAAPLVAEHFQVIVATHSPFAMGIKHAHYIEMSAGFLDESEEALAEWRSRLGTTAPDENCK